MMLSRLATAAAVAAVLVTVTACGGSSGHKSQAGPTAGSTTSRFSATADSTSDSPTFVNGGAALADNGNLVFVLEAVNPRIGTDKNDLIAKSKALCPHVNANESENRLEDEVSTSFTNGSWVPSESEALAIVATVKAYGGC